MIRAANLTQVTDYYKSNTVSKQNNTEKAKDVQPNVLESLTLLNHPPTVTVCSTYFSWLRYKSRILINSISASFLRLKHNNIVSSILNFTVYQNMKKNARATACVCVK